MLSAVPCAGSTVGAPRERALEDALAVTLMLPNAMPWEASVIIAKDALSSAAHQAVTSGIATALRLTTWLTLQSAVSWAVSKNITHQAAAGGVGATPRVALWLTLPSAVPGAALTVYNLHTPQRTGGVPYRLESLSAQDHDDSGDETPWSGWRLSQIGEAGYNNIDRWLDGVEYAEPRPPKKPGGCLRIDGSFLWFFLWFFFWFLSVVSVLTTVSTQSPGLLPEPGSLCVWG